VKSLAPMRDRVTEAEWATRVELAACYRLVARYGMADLIYNHITARVPGEEGHFLINPFGFLYEEITASCLFKIDLDGRVVERPDLPYEVNRAGFVIHSAVHAARHDVDCVIHTHTMNIPEICSMKQSLKIDIRDLTAGIAIICVGLFVALYASNHYQVGDAARMGPGYFPTMLGWIMAGVGLVIAFLSLRTSIHVLTPPPFTPRPFLAVVVAVALFALVIVVVTSAGSNSFQLPRSLLLAVSLAVISWLIFSWGLQMTLPAFAWEF
jgi:uncharacterized membrane protein YidH (DUF202 family)